MHVVVTVEASFRCSNNTLTVWIFARPDLRVYAQYKHTHVLYQSNLTHHMGVRGEAGRKVHYEYARSAPA